MSNEKKATAYQIIPRKYRPQVFADMVGQEAIVATLKNALRFQRLAHAYLFCGARGTGKTTLARLFAKALNCMQLGNDQEPCNQCPSCLDLLNGRSLDILEIDGASNRGIDDIRQINETVGYAPSSSRYKIYIIDEVHMLTKEAFNALLKTLEEPPANVKFFFATTEPHKVLPTIISRCWRFDLQRISEEAITAKLHSIAQDLNVRIDQEALVLLAKKASGSLRDAEALLDQVICYKENEISIDDVSKTLGLMPQNAYFELDLAIHSASTPFAFELAAQIFAEGKDLECFLEGLIEHFRLLLLLKLNASTALPSGAHKERYLASSALYTSEQCLHILDFLLSQLQQLVKTPFKRVHLEMILLHLMRSKQRVYIETIIKRLSEIETAISIETPPTLKSLDAHTESLPKKLPEVSRVISQTPIIEKKESIPQEKIPDIAPSSSPENNTAPASEAQKIPIEHSQNMEVQSAPPMGKNSAQQMSKYETLIRFAAVELEGILKKK